MERRLLTHHQEGEVPDGSGTWQVTRGGTQVRAPHMLEDQGAEIQDRKLGKAETITGPLSLPPS